jgi:uncharacterized protein
MNELIQYILYITPGILLLTITYLLTPKKSLISRILILIFGFILIRDAMTPFGFWQFGATPKSDLVLWLRFIEDSVLLISFGTIALISTLLILATNKDLSKLVKWGNYKQVKTYLIGLLGAVVVTAPFFLIYSGIPIESRGGELSTAVLPALLILALLGNFMEEVLFRGFLQGHYEKLYGAKKALILSALMFAVGHIFLAFTVTSVGIAIIIFTFYEGLICAYVRNQAGVISSTITHGLAIFLLASGLF